MNDKTSFFESAKLFIRKIFLNQRLKAWLKNTPEEEIAETCLRCGFTRWDSGDGRVTVLKKGVLKVRITR